MLAIALAPENVTPTRGGTTPTGDAEIFGSKAEYGAETTLSFRPGTDMAIPGFYGIWTLSS
jgi:hypothetical protein